MEEIVFNIFPVSSLQKRVSITFKTFNFLFQKSIEKFFILYVCVCVGGEWNHGSCHKTFVLKIQTMLSPTILPAATTSWALRLYLKGPTASLLNSNRGTVHLTVSIIPANGWTWKNTTNVLFQSKKKKFAMTIFLTA